MRGDISPDILLPVALQLYLHTEATWPLHMGQGTTVPPEQCAKILARSFANFYWELSSHLRAPDLDSLK